jgi:hypothetical protein
MGRPALLRKHFMHQIVRRIFDHLDFFEDHALFARDFSRRKRRPLQHVAQQIERHGQMFVSTLM